MNVAGHNSDLAGVRCNDTRAVRADQSGGGAFQRALDLHHIQHWNAFGNADHEWNFRVDCFEDRVRSKGRWHINHRGIGTRFFNGFKAAVEHGKTQMFLTALTGGDPTDHLRAIRDCLFRVERALAAGEALTDDFGVFVYKNCHRF